MDANTKNHAHTANSKIVEDAYLALAKVMDSKLFFSGGLSTQLLLPEQYHRTSSDLDLNGVPKFNLTTFSEHFAEAFEELSTKGYEHSQKSRHYTLDFNVENEDDFLILQYPRKSKNNVLIHMH